MHETFLINGTARYVIMYILELFQLARSLLVESSDRITNKARVYIILYEFFNTGTFIFKKHSLHVPSQHQIDFSN